MEIIPSLPNDIARECLIRVPYNHFSALSSVCKTWKEEIESRNFHNQRKVLGFSRSIVVIAQPDSTSANRLTLYEPATGDWRRLPLDPNESDGLPLFCHLAGVGRNLVVIGGWNSRTWECSNTTRVFDFVSGTWHRGANMPGPPRSFFACASDSDRTVYVAGGHVEGKTALRSVLAYDVVNDDWVPLPDMARERDECKGIFHGGKFHVIGGYSTEMQGRFEKSAEVLDTATCQWGQVEDLLETGACPRNCVMDEEGRMYCHLEGHVAVLDGSTWKKVRELPVDVSVWPFFVTCWGKILVIGSNGYDNSPIRSYELEIGEEYTWKKVVMPMVFDRSVQTGCSLEI